MNTVILFVLCEHLSGSSQSNIHYCSESSNPVLLEDKLTLLQLCAVSSRLATARVNTTVNA